MNNATEFLGKVLLPYDGSSSAREALKFATALGQLQCRGVENLTLLRVIGGGYLARHIQNVDLRVLRLDQTKEWQRIRRRYLEEEIMPLLAEAKELLQQYEFPAPIEMQVAEGKVGEKILEVAQTGKYASIILGRRGLSPVKELVMGSTTRHVLNRAAGLSVFVVGPEERPGLASPLFPLLLPVDGSAASLAAVRLAAGLAQGCTIAKPQIILLHVVDLALLGLTLAEEARLLMDEGVKALAEARQILDQAGLKDYTEEKLLSGNPAHVIAQEAEARQCALILMGSVGHSALSRLFIGSVTNSVLHLVTQPTVAVVYP